jgi:hypothetical protein
VLSSSHADPLGHTAKPTFAELISKYGIVLGSGAPDAVENRFDVDGVDGVVEQADELTTRTAASPPAIHGTERRGLDRLARGLT